MLGKLKTGMELEESGVRILTRKADDSGAFCIVMKGKDSASPQEYSE